MKKTCSDPLFLLLLLLWQGTALALVVEESIQVPVKVQTMHGREIEQEIHVVLYVENNSPKPRPILILNHGRSGNAGSRAKLNPRDYSAQARWLTGFGFVVAVPVRVGYGASGGIDVEYSGTCQSRNYPAVYKAAAVQTIAVLEALRKRDDTAKDRAVVMGQSFGGTTAITIAGMAPAGIQGTVNFAGGGGGNPTDNPMNPCSPHAMEATFADYGKTARMPTLWLYSENDLYWGPKYPREWFDAFKEKGGVGEFVMFPPVSDDGHRMFSRGASLWQPKVREFLATLGYQPVK